MPVAFSHSGPEKFSGSSDWRPASQTIVISDPAYFFAASTAVCAEEPAAQPGSTPVATSPAALAARKSRLRIVRTPPRSHRPGPTGPALRRILAGGGGLGRLGWGLGGAAVTPFGDPADRSHRGVPPPALSGGPSYSPPAW